MAKLYIVGTPIGNLGDLSPRAAEVLRTADVIACEDTRHSRPLLMHIGAKGRTVAYHKFNEQECARKIADIVREGKNVALITDAGMPSVSDPGAEVVALCVREGVEVESVPGPSAVTTAVALSGVKGKGFVFLGFLPEKQSERKLAVERAARACLPIVIYAAPHDVKRLAAELGEVLGDRRVCAVREMTKLHESVVWSSLLSFECEERGEIVLVIEGAEEENALLALSPEEHLAAYISSGMDKKEAVKRVAAERGVPKNDIYKLTL